jgi:hypothetical protein
MRKLAVRIPRAFLPRVFFAAALASSCLLLASGPATAASSAGGRAGDVGQLGGPARAGELPSHVVPRRGPCPGALCVFIGKFSVPYKSSWRFTAKHIRVCAQFTATGKITYSLWAKTIPPDGTSYIWTKQRLVDPTLQAKMRYYNPHTRGCGGPKNLTKELMAQRWTGYRCSFNPSLGFSAPWGVFISGWPTCGNRRQAVYATSYGRGSHYRQFNDGSRTAFGYVATPPNGIFSPPCYGVFVSATLWEGDTSESYGAGNNPHVSKVCLNKK